MHPFIVTTYDLEPVKLAQAPQAGEHRVAVAVELRDRARPEVDVLERELDEARQPREPLPSAARASARVASQQWPRAAVD
jgi:hypothetical protein